MTERFFLLKCIGKAVLKAAVNAVPIAGPILVGIAEDVRGDCAKEKEQADLRDEMGRLVRATAQEMRTQIEEIVPEIAADQPEPVQRTVAAYLAQVPGTIHQSLRRPSDPTGKTVPGSLRLAKAEDLLPFLPMSLPRFKQGARPLPGVDWELVELLGTGGFGEVWTARNPHFGSVRPVALKFCLDPAVKDRLPHHEAAMLNQVMHEGRHPGIVALQHTYLSADPYCLEYEYVSGGDLAGLIKERPSGLPIDQAAQVILKLAKIVGYAHRLHPPIVHRDLKPANILVQRTADNKVQLKIADFGIGGVAAEQAIDQATRMGAGSGQFLATEVRGAHTPLYASPQQAGGSAPDPRDDVYALGVIWYQLLTCNLSAGCPTGAKWQEKLAAKGMPGDVVKLLVACLEDLREDRPASAAVLAERLAAIVSPGKALKDSSAGGQEPPDFLSYLRSGEAHAAEGAYDDAIADFTAAISLKPREAATYFKRAEANMNSGRSGSAIDDCTEAIRLGLTSSAVYLLRGRAHHYLGHYRQGVTDLTEAIRLDPQSAAARERRGWANYWSKDHDQAIADCTEAIRLDPQLAPAYSCRGWAYQEKKEFDRPIADSTEAIRLQPDHFDAYYNRGCAHANKRNWDRAIQDFDDALRINPQSTAVAYERGVAHAAKGDHEQAIAEFDRVIKKNSKHAQAYYRRGLAYKQLGDEARAKEDHEAAMRLDPKIGST